MLQFMSHLALSPVLYNCLLLDCVTVTRNRKHNQPIGGHKLFSCQRGGATPLNLFKTTCKLCLCSAPPPRLCLGLHLPCLALLLFALTFVISLTLPCAAFAMRLLCLVLFEMCLFFPAFPHIYFTPTFTLISPASHL